MSAETLIRRPGIHAIRRALSFGLTLLALSVSSALAHGEAVRLQGQFVQGGVIFGHGVPGARVVLNGRELRVSPAGRVVFGFGRDAPGGRDGVE